MAPLCYRRHPFPPKIIQHAIWLYVRFTLSYRDVEELLAERGIDISYETISHSMGAVGRFRSPRVAAWIHKIRGNARGGRQRFSSSTKGRAVTTRS